MEGIVQSSISVKGKTRETSDCCLGIYGACSNTGVRSGNPKWSVRVCVCENWDTQDTIGDTRRQQTFSSTKERHQNRMIPETAVKSVQRFRMEDSSRISVKNETTTVQSDSSMMKDNNDNGGVSVSFPLSREDDSGSCSVSDATSTAASDTIEPSNHVEIALVVGDSNRPPPQDDDDGDGGQTASSRKCITHTSPSPSSSSTTIPATSPMTNSKSIETTKLATDNSSTLDQSYLRIESLLQKISVEAVKSETLSRTPDGTPCGRIESLVQRLGGGWSNSEKKRNMATTTPAPRSLGTDNMQTATPNPVSGCPSSPSTTAAASGCASAAFGMKAGDVTMQRVIEVLVNAYLRKLRGTIELHRNLLSQLEATANELMVVPSSSSGSSSSCASPPPFTGGDGDGRDNSESSSSSSSRSSTLCGVLERQFRIFDSIKKGQLDVLSEHRFLCQNLENRKCSCQVKEDYSFMRACPELLAEIEEILTPSMTKGELEGQVQSLGRTMQVTFLSNQAAAAVTPSNSGSSTGMTTTHSHPAVSANTRFTRSSRTLPPVSSDHPYNLMTVREKRSRFIAQLDNSADELLATTTTTTVPIRRPTAPPAAALKVIRKKPRVSSSPVSRSSDEMSGGGSSPTASSPAPHSSPVVAASASNAQHHPQAASSSYHTYEPQECEHCRKRDTPQWRFILNKKYCNACYMRVKRYFTQKLNEAFPPSRVAPSDLRKYEVPWRGDGRSRIDCVRDALNQMPVLEVSHNRKSSSSKAAAAAAAAFFLPPTEMVDTIPRRPTPV